MVNDVEVTRHRFRFGEETYTICVTKDDWWIEESLNMSDLMMRCGEEFALDHGMLPPVAAGKNGGRNESINRVS